MLLVGDIDLSLRRFDFRVFDRNESVCHHWRRDLLRPCSQLREAWKVIIAKGDWRKM